MFSNFVEVPIRPLQFRRILRVREDPGEDQPGYKSKVSIPLNIPLEELI